MEFVSFFGFDQAHPGTLVSLNQIQEFLKFQLLKKSLRYKDTFFHMDIHQ